MGLLPETFWSMTFFEYANYSRYILEEDKRMWWHTSSLMALHANLNRDPKRTPQPFKPETFYPYETKKKKAKFVHQITNEHRDLTSQWAQKFKDKDGATGNK